jgi:hypothetical protein
VLWVGEIDDLELTIARESLVRLTGCIVIRETAPAPSSPSSPHGSDLLGTSPPDCILLAIDRPGRWSVEQVLGLSLNFPLTPIFAIATSLGDGRRRSGPPLPGVEELAWHDAGGRLARWFADPANREAGKQVYPALMNLSDQGSLEMAVEQVYDLAEAAAALAHADRPGRQGKVLLRGTSRPLV